MKSILRFLIITLLLSTTITGCYYDKEDILYKSGCDTAKVTYSLSIIPITIANCNVCHSEILANGGVVTENYIGLNTVAKNGKLWAAVNWTGPYHMPKDANKLSNCDLAKIKKWIDAGAPDN